MAVLDTIRLTDILCSAQLKLATPLTAQTIGTGPVKLAYADTERIINGSCVTPSHANSRFTVSEGGDFRFTFAAAGEWGNLDEIFFTNYKNGAIINPNGGVFLIGRGAKPVLMIYDGVFTFEAGDYHEVFCNVATGSSSLVIKSATVTMERLP